MRILICGVGGRMGREVVALASAGVRGAEAVAGVDLQAVEFPGFPTYTDIREVKETADCIVDFSHHTATSALLAYAREKGIPTVIATTGHTEEESAEILDAAREIPIFHSANMSLGIALLVELARLTAKTLPDAEIEIIEKHHDRKLDAPSGTALLLANELKEVRKDATIVCGRSGYGKRTREEIGIHAIRMGNIVGEHEVIIGTDAQTITLKHEAHSRALFASGALAAAEFLVKQPAGLYDMKRMISAM